jgi:hypothetical protein
VEAYSARADSDLPAGTAHGTACAEIIHEWRGADLVLVNFSTELEFAARSTTCARQAWT